VEHRGAQNAAAFEKVQYQQSIGQQTIRSIIAGMGLGIDFDGSMSSAVPNLDLSK
jgi:hypothetical protein